MVGTSGAICMIRNSDNHAMPDGYSYKTPIIMAIRVSYALTNRLVNKLPSNGCDNLTHLDRLSHLFVPKTLKMVKFTPFRVITSRE